MKQFIGGYRLEGNSHSPKYVPRSVTAIASEDSKKFQIKVRYPEREAENKGDQSVWDSLAKEFKKIVDKNRATLFFTNGRRLCEKLTFKINNLSKKPVAYSHHGSLSKQLRHDVEQKLKAGDLNAIVATSSLEMGIDIGNLNEVVLVQSPPSVSSSIQRVGRAGHQVGQKSCGIIFCAHPHDLIHSAVLSRAILQQNIEPLKPVLCPLDVLAQIVISMTGMETWDMDELFVFLKTSFPFHDLSRKQYDLVLNMLAGRYSNTRIRELTPRVSIDRLDNTVAGKKGALLALYMSGGTIPDRGYYQLRHQESNARIGELDEEFVWEAKIGQITTFGTQNWKITRITHNDVFAIPAGNRVMNAPFWIAENINRDFHFSREISGFLENANERLESKEFLKELKQVYHMEVPAAKRLVRFLKKQKEKTTVDLPYHGHLVLEYVRSGPDGGPGSQLVMHTLWGGRLNRPYALALEAAWEERFNEKTQIYPGNDAIVIQIPKKIDPEVILSLVTAGSLEHLLQKQLESSGFFAARFRECAGRALLVTRNKINQRMPLWMTRLRSQKLLESIIGFEDFPILLETWRTCLWDEFDMPNLEKMVDRIENGSITWSVTHTSSPSPFAANMAWDQINQYMYQTDQGASSASSLASNLIQDVVFSPNLRPMVPAAIINTFEQKRQRLAKGYAPGTSRDLLDWIKERIAIPLPEWKLLMNAMQSDHGNTLNEILNPAFEKIIRLEHPEAGAPLIIALELLPGIMKAWYKTESSISFFNMDDSPARPDSTLKRKNSRETDEDNTFAVVYLSQWLQFYGPKPVDFTLTSLGINKNTLKSMLHSLVESRVCISGKLTEKGTKDEICDSENFETLLRILRADAIPRFDALDITWLPLFLAHHQGLTRQGNTPDDLFNCLEQLTCLPLNAALWESDILPARIKPYHTSFLDTLMQEGELKWQGAEKEKIAFYFEPDLDLMQTLSPNGDEGQACVKNKMPGSALSIFELEHSRYDFSALLRITELDAKTLSHEIWNAVWQGKLSNETFLALRKGIENKFTLPHSLGKKDFQEFGRRRTQRRMHSRSGFSKWQGSLPFAGHWFSTHIPKAPLDFIEIEELNKDRTRLLLDRYGILFRELLQREVPSLQWASVFRSLRLMELSGEILSGYFFKEIPGPQFISQKAFRQLTGRLPGDTIFWLNAADPASACGIALDGLRQMLPKRLSSTHLVFKGNDLVMISEKKGKKLYFNCPPDDENLVQYLAQIKHLLHRQFSPLKSITVETINDEDAAKSPYAQAFKTAFDTLIEFKKLILYKRT
ncbi:MAG: ATP-dependent helicase, partial [Desulfobacteraceae bacterium]|nr:ATP-dependent helicase [Desulfobacteraceae bacterium]